MDLLATLRSRIEVEVAKHQHNNALFWADKAITLSGNDAKDIFTYVNILYLKGEYHRAIYFIVSNNLQSQNYGTYLIAKVIYAAISWNDMPLYIIALAKSDVLLINVIFKPHVSL